MMLKLRRWAKPGLLLCILLIVSVLLFLDEAVEYVFYDDIPAAGVKVFEMPDWVDIQLSRAGELLPDDEKLQAAVMPKEGPDQEGLQVGWVLKIEQPLTEGSVKLITEQLNKAGYHVYFIRTLSANRRPVIAGFVGPWLMKQKAVDVGKVLAERFLIASKVKPFEP